MIAWFNGIFGVLSAFVVGQKVLGLSYLDIAMSILVSWISGLVALLTVLKAERIFWFKKKAISGSLQTWMFFLLMYYGPLWIFVPVLRELKSFLTMVIPLALANGFVILVFGPIQDRIVAGLQRKSE